MRIQILRSVLIAYCFFSASQSIAQTIDVKDAPRPFSVSAPASWIRQEASAAGSPIRFVAPPGTPSAICSVLAKEMLALKDRSQPSLDREMAMPMNPKDFASQYASILSDLEVFETETVSISSFPAQLANVKYRARTPRGEVWLRGIIATTATTPGLIWTASCAGIGKDALEAQQSYSYWQSEMRKFRDNIKIQ